MILSSVSRYSGVICSTVSSLRMPRSSPQLTVREMNWDMAAPSRRAQGSRLAVECWRLEGWAPPFNSQPPTFNVSTSNNTSHPEVVQVFILQPQVVDHLPHGRERLLRVRPHRRRQILPLQQRLQAPIQADRLLLSRRVHPGYHALLLRSSMPSPPSPSPKIGEGVISHRAPLSPGGRGVGGEGAHPLRLSTRRRAFSSKVGRLPGSTR